MRKIIIEWYDKDCIAYYEGLEDAFSVGCDPIEAVRKLVYYDLIEKERKNDLLD